MRILSLLWFLLSVTNACAHEITISGGITQYTKSGDGFWYQEAFPYEIRNTTISYGIKYLTSDNTSKFQFGVEYKFLGRITSSSLAVASDANYNSETLGCNGKCWPLSHWYGSGSVQSVSALVHYNFSSGMYVEGGISVTRAKWDVYIPDWLECADCKSKAVSVTEPKVYSYDPVIAVGYRSGPWNMQISAHATHDKGEQYQMIYKAYSTNVSIGYTIKF